MGNRPELDLSSILGSYMDFLPTQEESEALRQVQVPDEGLRYNSPVRLGWGPDRWSTCTALVPVVRVCHDVNGYYRELKVDWRASRKELMQAYMAVDGQSSARLTYVFKQLLDPLVREAYDRSPAGELFLDDYTEADLKRRAREEAQRRSVLFQSVSPEEVLEEWGYVNLDPEEEGVDTVRGVGKDSHQRRGRQQREWRYSFYAWKTRDFVQDEGLLRTWQELLSEAAARAGVAPEIALGVTSMSDQPFMLERVGGTTVIFFSTEMAPTPETADQAISEFTRFHVDSVS